MEIIEMLAHAKDEMNLFVEEDLSSKNHGNSGLDAATGKEMTMEQLKKAIEAIKALFANYAGRPFALYLAERVSKHRGIRTPHIRSNS